VSGNRTGSAGRGPSRPKKRRRHRPPQLALFRVANRVGDHIHLGRGPPALYPSCRCRRKSPGSPRETGATGFRPPSISAILTMFPTDSRNDSTMPVSAIVVRIDFKRKRAPPSCGSHTVPSGVICAKSRKCGRVGPFLVRERDRSGRADGTTSSTATFEFW